MDERKRQRRILQKKTPIAFIATIHDLRDQFVRPMHLVQDKTYKIGESYPSELSCKQDLGQDTRYRNVSRS